MKAIRLISIILVGRLLTYLTFKSRYQIFCLEAVVWAFSICVGIILFLWSTVQDYKNYQSTKNLLSFLPTAIVVMLTLLILSVEYDIKADFEKPSLLAVYYDGDINGSGIDFKNDGTYIFQSSAVGLSNFKYGTYKIYGDKIVIDNNELDNVVTTNLLEVRLGHVEYADSTRSERFLYQLSNSGHILDEAIEFRVVVDNRNKSTSPH